MEETTTPQPFQPIPQVQQVFIPQANFDNKDQPVFKEIMRGIYINDNEYNSIVRHAIFAYKSGQNPIATALATALNTETKRDWLVVVHPLEKRYDFTTTCLKGGNFFSFTLDSTVDISNCFLVKRIAKKRKKNHITTTFYYKTSR